MRRLLLASAAVLATTAFAAPAAPAAEPLHEPYECHMFIHCTVYSPVTGEEITSYDEIRALLPIG